MSKSFQWLCVVSVLFLPIFSPAQEWVARYNGPGNDVDMAVAIALDNSGNIYITGRSRGSGTDYDYATVKYDSSGVEQWVARYNGPGNGYDIGLALDTGLSGNVYVTGGSKDTNGYLDYFTIAYSSSGSELWVARYEEGIIARAIIVDKFEFLDSFSLLFQSIMDHIIKN